MQFFVNRDVKVQRKDLFVRKDVLTCEPSYGRRKLCPSNRFNIERTTIF